MKIPKRNPELIAQYREDNWHRGDEMAEHIEWQDWMDLKKKAKFDPNWKQDLHVHHIWGGNAYRYDVVPNIVLIKSLTHNYLHGAGVAYYTNILVGTFVKVQKGEFDRDVMRVVAGRDVISLIEAIECNEDWLEAMKLYILESF